MGGAGCHVERHGGGTWYNIAMWRYMVQHCHVVQYCHVEDNGMHIDDP